MDRENYKPWQITPYTRDQFTQLDMREKLLFLCHLGHLAPSSHNTQPWRFFIDPEHSLIDIYIDRSFVLLTSDVVGRQATISLGCAVENMAVGASYLIGPPHIEIFCQKKKSIPVLMNQRDATGQYILMARFHYITKASALPIEHLYKSIFSRKVMRAEFNPHIRLTPATIRKLEATTDEKKTKLHIITDPIRKLGIAEFQGQADGFVINSPRFSKELGQWLLQNDTNSPLGMPGVGFGLKDDEAVRIHRGLSGQSPLQPEDNLKFALAGKFGIEKSPFIGCITISKDEVPYWIEAGRSFEHMFLTLESQGISVAIHAGIVEVPMVNRLFAVSLGTFRRPTVLFRAGILKNEKDKNRPHSPRLPIENVLLSKRPA